MSTSLEISVTKSRIETKEMVKFEVLPLDNCRISTTHGVGMPVAIAPIASGRYVRYICRECRHIWDCYWSSPEGLVDTFGDSYSSFKDRLIGSREGLVSHPHGDIEWPVGPSKMFRKGA